MCNIVYIYLIFRDFLVHDVGVSLFG